MSDNEAVCKELMQMIHEAADALTAIETDYFNNNLTVEQIAEKYDLKVDFVNYTIEEMKTLRKNGESFIREWLE